MSHSQFSPVTVTDIHIPFWSLVWLVMKLWLAALIASVLLGAIGIIFVLILTLLGVGALEYG